MNHLSGRDGGVEKHRGCNGGFKKENGYAGLKETHAGLEKPILAANRDKLTLLPPNHGKVSVCKGGPHG